MSDDSIINDNIKGIKDSGSNKKEKEGSKKKKGSKKKEGSKKKKGDKKKKGSKKKEGSNKNIPLFNSRYNNNYVYTQQPLEHNLLSTTMPLEQATMPLEQATMPLKQATMPLEQAITVPLEQAIMPLKQATMPLEHDLLPITVPLEQAHLKQPLINKIEETEKRKKELEKEHNEILERIELNKNVKYVSPKEENLIKFKNNIIKKVFNVDLVGGYGIKGKSEPSVETGKSEPSVETGKSKPSVETGKSKPSVEIVEVRTPFENKLSILNHIKNNYDLTNKKKRNVVFLNKENKPETLVVNTQMMKNYLKHVNEGSTNTPLQHIITNHTGGYSTSYSISYLIMQ
jgi:hypothetical protein